MKKHVLKSWSKFFKPIIDGTRTSDIRTNTDRNFEVGDTLILREWNPLELQYTGRCAVCKITYIQQNIGNPCAVSHQAINDGYSVLSIKCLASYSGKGLNLDALYSEDSGYDDPILPTGESGYVQIQVACPSGSVRLFSAANDNGNGAHSQ
jgi:hypothetical protein